MARPRGAGEVCALTRAADKALFGCDMDPKKSIELLDALAALGFTDRAFATLHHFRFAGRDATIQEHRRYCERTEDFQGDGENERVQKRLALVLTAYTSGGFRSRAEKVFVALAQAAMEEIPPLRAREHE
jgi:hypothetical protein